MLLGACNYVLGELYQAHEYYRQALSQARQHEDREITVRALLGLAGIHFAWNELTLCEQQASEALALAAEELANLHSDAALQLVQIAEARGQITQAQQQLARLVARLQTASRPEAAQRLTDALLFSARLALKTGDVRMGQQILATPALQKQTAAQLVRGRLLLIQNKSYEALHELEHLQPAPGEWRLAVEIHILLALAHISCQQERQAREQLWQALQLALPAGLTRIFLAEGKALLHLLRRMVPVLDNAELRSYAQRILRASALREEQQRAIKPASSTDLLVRPLSLQEQRVLRLLVAGNTNQEIAHELVITINTVKDHVKHLYRKLGVSNRLQASEMAHRLHLLDT
ncbi:LuxR C-terminal-related transcriptional regulator [Ktedonosporobacter rubrisoli]|nr:LuxR C-terminal-related transcriptional regulator [Ktedonosporobacter rubrisoli]